jgi:hypothetical protein
MNTAGDTVYGGASGAATRLAGDTSNTKKWLRSLSSGGTAAAPSWEEVDQVKGQTSGSVVAAGYIGEKITWSSAPATANLGTSTADWTNASIVLSAGVWLIYANICLSVVTGNSAANSSYAQVYITDSSNNTVQNQEKRLLVLTPAAGSTQVVSAVPFNFVASVSGSTTYKIRALRVDAAGTGSAQIRNAGADYSEFFAVRIA